MSMKASTDHVNSPSFMGGRFSSPICVSVTQEKKDTGPSLSKKERKIMWRFKPPRFNPHDKIIQKNPRGLLEHPLRKTERNVTPHFFLFFVVPLPLSSVTKTKSKDEKSERGL